MFTQLAAAARHPRATAQGLKVLSPFGRGAEFARGGLQQPAWPEPLCPRDARNPLLDYFDAHAEGPGISKWRHYFDIYHRHFAKFIGRDVHIMELGVFSGGSMPMWRQYLGERSRVYGVDINPACLEYRQDGVEIFIGDQSDRAFWARVRAAVPRIDIFIDDGGHHPLHQAITLEEMLPHVAPGGVYICEDLHGAPNAFASYAYGFASEFNSHLWPPIMSTIDSMHFYPYMAVIEKCDRPRPHTSSELHGTEWIARPGSS